MLTYKEDIRKGTITTVVNDQLFQEKEVQKTITVIENEEEVEQEITVTERVIIEDRIAKAFTCKASKIDSLFSEHGGSILTTNDYTDQHDTNKLNILMLQTSLANWQQMDEWIVDTEHELVKQFSE